jgi:hypothetical protein
MLKCFLQNSDTQAVFIHRPLTIQVLEIKSKISSAGADMVKNKMAALMSHIFVIYPCVKSLP